MPARPGPRKGGPETHSCSKDPPLSPLRPAHSLPGTGTVLRRPSAGGHRRGGRLEEEVRAAGASGPAGHRKGPLEQVRPPNREGAESPNQPGAPHIPSGGPPWLLLCGIQRKSCSLSRLQLKGGGGHGSRWSRMLPKHAETHLF